VRDPLYVAARRALLDALEALTDHLDAHVLVGAQAVYVHAGEADLAVAPATTDGDLAIDPQRLGAAPILDDAMAAAGFTRQHDIAGIWQRPVDVGGTIRTVQVDLLVPDSLGGPGRRGARIPPHGNRVARKVVGLEGALIDRDPHPITAFDATDERAFRMAVAGPAALIVAKVHKISQRVDDADRRNDKDALDVYRLLRATSTEDLARRFRLLRNDPVSRPVSEQALELLAALFESSRRSGTQMAIRAAGPLELGGTIAASLGELTADLLRLL
jgi:hypothetical protein